MTIPPPVVPTGTLPSKLPTAMQAVADVHATPFRPMLNGVPEYAMGLGVLWITQLDPFQRSASIAESCVSALVNRYDPTAVHAVAVVHDTPVNGAPCAPAGPGVLWIDQLLPSQRSARLHLQASAAEGCPDRGARGRGSARHAEQPGSVKTGTKNGRAWGALDRPAGAVPDLRQRLPCAGAPDCLAGRRGRARHAAKGGAHVADGVCCALDRPAAAVPALGQRQGGGVPDSLAGRCGGARHPAQSAVRHARGIRDAVNGPTAAVPRLREAELMPGAVEV